MPEALTPAQIAHEAYVTHVQRQHAASLWHTMAPDDRAAWEAAAQAVLDAAKAQEEHPHA